MLSACPLMVAPNGLARYSAMLAMSCWRDEAAQAHGRQHTLGLLVVADAGRLRLVADHVADPWPFDQAGEQRVDPDAIRPSSIASVRVKPITPHFAAA